MKSGPTAASLRWRSRISKEAVNQDDSDVVDWSNTPNETNKAKAFVEDYGLGGDDKTKSRRFGCLRSSFQFWSSLLATVSSALALLVLEVDLSWFTAVLSSLQIFLSLLLVYAVRRIRRLGSVRQQVHYARQRVQSLSLQNERLYRQLHHLDGMQNRLESVRHDLNKLIGKNDPQRMVQVIQRWRVMQKQLNVVLRQQVQQEIIQATLETDRDANFEMSAQELERLILRLRNMPGIHLNEHALRRQLEREDDRSLQAILRLIRRILEDTSGDVEMMASSSAIIQLDAKSLCKASRQTRTDANLLQV